MGREWSRRSIEEIARKIGEGLGGGWTGYAGSSGIYTDELNSIILDDEAIYIHAYYDIDRYGFLGFLDSECRLFHPRLDGFVRISDGNFIPFDNSVIPRELHKTLISNRRDSTVSGYREVRLADYSENELRFYPRRAWLYPQGNDTTYYPSIKVLALWAFGTEAINVLNYLGNNDSTEIYIKYPLGE